MREERRIRLKKIHERCSLKAVWGSIGSVKKIITGICLAIGALGEQITKDWNGK
jgi:hypothetical protein